MHPALVLHIPHSSTCIPADFRSSLALSDTELSRELLAMTDWFTDELFELSGAIRIVFPISRLVLDPERFLDDEKEPMARRGMGVIYSRTSSGRPLRREPTLAHRKHLIERFYIPHHRTLTEAVDRALTSHGHVLLLDCHSFPSVPLPNEVDQSSERPQMCLGTDPFHTPGWLLAAARKAFESSHLSVAVNRPFSGALVPTSHHGQDNRVLALMIEVNRSTYMEESDVRPRETFDAMRTLLQDVAIELLVAFSLHANPDK